jgi:ribosomal protein S18 acetylase RimI-like enzyme
LFNKNYEHLVDQDARSSFSPEWMLDNLRLFPGDALLTIKVAYHNEAPVGFVMYSTDSKNRGNLDVLCVDSRYRNSGYGFQLLDHAAQDLKKRGASIIKLGVSNPNAIRLYAKYGFKEKKKWNAQTIIMKYNFSPNKTKTRKAIPL